jgi:hypothetical protein
MKPNPFYRLIMLKSSVSRMKQQYLATLNSSRDLMPSGRAVHLGGLNSYKGTWLPIWSKHITSALIHDTLKMSANLSPLCRPPYVHCCETKMRFYFSMEM